MEPQHLPLLLAARRFAGDDETQPLDRIRMQKGVFLLEQGSAQWHGLHDYTPYDWGPFSRTLASDLSRLVKSGALDVERSRYGSYRTTATGERVVAELVADELSDEEADFVRRVRRFVTTRTFHRLLRDLYKAFPDYAVNSRFSG